jgi:hypothetical protein
MIAMAPKIKPPPNSRVRMIKDQWPFFSVSVFVFSFLPCTRIFEIIHKSKCPSSQNISAMGNNMIAGGCPPLEVARTTHTVRLTIAQTILRIRNRVAAHILTHLSTNEPSMVANLQKQSVA